MQSLNILGIKSDTQATYRYTTHISSNAQSTQIYTWWSLGCFDSRQGCVAPSGDCPLDCPSSRRREVAGWVNDSHCDSKRVYIHIYDDMAYDMLTLVVGKCEAVNLCDGYTSAIWWSQAHVCGNRAMGTLDIGRLVSG